MPLREFGGRAAGGALGLQHGNIVTDALGNIAVVFGVPFGAVPDIVANVLDPANNYYVVIRTRTALGFTAHVRRIAAVNSGNSTVNIATQPTQTIGDLLWENGPQTTIGLGQPAITPTILGSGHTHTVTADAAAGAGVTVMWMAVS
jgi:hypothetical protein